MQLAQNKEESWFIYIIEADNGYLYTGITTSLEKRFNAHKSTGNGAKFFHTSAPKQIVFIEKASSRGEASRREYAIKQLSRKEKLSLINDYRRLYG